MFRHFGSFAKLTYERLHRLARLDMLKLNDTTSNNQALDQYDKLVSSSNDFLPEDVLMNQSKKSLKIESSPMISNSKISKKFKDENYNLIDAQSINLIIDLLKSKKFYEIKSILSTYHYTEFYYPIEYNTNENLSILENFPDPFDYINLHIEELGISGWLQLTNFFYYHLKTREIYKNSSFRFRNPQSDKKGFSSILIKSNLVEICKFINKARMIFVDFNLDPEIESFLLSENKNSLNELSDLDLINVLIAYPTGRNLDHTKYFPRLIEKYDLIPIHFLIDLMVKMKDTGYKIPIKLINRVDKASSELFFNSHNEECFIWIKKFIYIEMISYEIMKYACNCFTKINTQISDDQPAFYRFFKLISESDYFHLLLKNQHTLMNIIELSSSLKPHQHLYVITNVIYHLKDYSLLKDLVVNLETASEDFSVKYANDIIDAQKKILDFAEEEGIYHYQFFSFKTLENNFIKTVSKILNEMIYSVNPNHDMVYKYYFSILSDELPPPGLLESIKPDNLHWARLLWHTRDSVQSQNLAKVALSQSPQSQNAEYLYYLTSIAPSNINLSSIPPSNFSLALSYNLSKQSPIANTSLPTHPSIIQFNHLPTEATMKTIIKLVELNDLKQIKSAIEFIGFIPDNHPKFSSSLIKDLIKALSEVNPSLINAQSIKVHLMKAAKEFSPEDLKQISKFLIYLPKNIIHEFMESFNVKGKLFRYDDEENILKCKEFVEKFRGGELGKNLVHELKVVDFFDFACKEFILGIFEQEGFQDDENMKLKIILEIVGNTSPDREIQEKVVWYVNKFNLWDQLSFQDLCNFCLAHSKHQVFLPNYIYEKFLAMIYAKLKVEEKYRHPINDLICIKPFKYVTVLEPRTVISNNIAKKRLRKESPYALEIPYHEVENNIKVLAYINSLKLSSTPDINESVNIFFQNRNSENTFFNEKLNILEDLTQIFGESSIQENVVDTNSRWIQDFYIESQKLSIKVLHKNDYYITSDFKFELKYLTQMMITQLKQNNNLVCINPTEWNKMTLPEKQNLISQRN